MSDLTFLRPPAVDAFPAASAANLFGFMPPIYVLVRTFERWGFVLCSGGIFKRTETLLARSGRPPTDEEQAESAANTLRARKVGASGEPTMALGSCYERALRDAELEPRERELPSHYITWAKRVEASGDVELIEAVRSGRIGLKRGSEMALDGLSTESGGGLE